VCAYHLHVHALNILALAHNIEDASRSAGSFETDEESFDVVMKELNLVVKFGGAQEAHKTIESVCIDNNVPSYYQ
jgi:hypothetical protein